MTRSMTRQCIKLTEFLGKVLGSDFEIALHDMSVSSGPVIALANGQLSGKSVGAPLSDPLQKFLKERPASATDFYVNFSGISTSTNRMLRCSAFFIHDDEDSIVGILCINFDENRYREASERILRLRPVSYHTHLSFECNQEAVLQKSNVQISGDGMRKTIDQLIEAAIIQVSGSEHGASPRLSSSEKLRIVGLLDEKGVFLLKGAVKQVADHLNCSQASVYRYLNRVNENKDKPKEPVA